MKYLIGKITKEWSVISSEWRYFRKVAYITGDGFIIDQQFVGNTQEELEERTDCFIQAMRPTNDNS